MAREISLQKCDGFKIYKPAYQNPKFNSPWILLPSKEYG